MSLCWVPLPTEMYVLTLVILLQGLGVAWPASTSPPLGMTVHVVPLDSTQGQTVRAHFTAVVSGECTDVTGLCADGEDCLVEPNTVPFTGAKPGGGWCSHHWQKTLPANFAGTVKLGSSTEMHVALKADPVIRGNSGKLNHPAFVGLPPPLRATEKCPHHFPLSVRDLDGDWVHCRFAREDQGECTDCQPHSFVELEQGTCTITFNGNAVAGVYHIYLMAEDVVPAPQIVVSTQSKPMSAVPFVLSLTVEKAKYSCSAEPVATVENPAENSVWPILPFGQRSFTVNYDSNEESVVEVAVIGPPQLYRTGFLSLKPIASMSFAWVRGENKLARLLPICFLANTQNLQSEPRCVWLYQREMTSLPAGTVLTCGNTEMNLVLPISSFTNINLAELQLNSPDCPISYNDTHLTATIPLEGCGTKAVHQSDELIYTNTLKTVSASTQVIRRKPILVLPLACRIPAVQASGPQYEISIPVEKEVFGEVEFKIEFYFPGSGPLREFTSNAVLRYDNHRVRARRVQRDLRANDTTTTSPAISASSSGASSATSSSGGNNSTANTSAANGTSPSAATGSPNITAATTVAATGQIGSKINTLDLHVSSNCSVDRAEILVSTCIESATEDFAVFHELLDGGCTASESTLEVITTESGTKIYRVNLKRINSEGSTMYVRCTVNLCITTQPSQVCPDLCTTKLTRATMVNSVFSSSYTVTSKAVSLVYTTPAPTTTTTTPTTTATTTAAAKPTVITTTTTTTTTTTATSAATTTTTPAASTTTTPAVTTVTTTTAAATLNTTSHAPEKAPSVAVGVMMALACIFLQPFFY